MFIPSQRLSDPARARLMPIGLGLLLFATVLAVYLLTLAPGVLGGDPGEMQFVPRILGMSHPTGFPLYMLLGRVWGALPLGPSVAWRMNLLAAVSASLAIFVVYLCVHRLTGRLVPALGAALYLAFGSSFWKLATVADKYAFNALLVAVVLYLVMRWGETRSPGLLYLTVFAYGVSLAHHRTMILFAVPLLGYLWWLERGALWRDRRRLLRMALLFLLPLLLYLYVPWAEARDLPPGTWKPDTLWEWSQYFADVKQTQHLSLGSEGLLQRLLFYASTLQHDFTWIGVLLGVLGLGWQIWRRRPEAFLLLIAFLPQGALAADFDKGHRWVYFLPSFLIFALWIGEGLGLVIHAISRVGARRARLASVAAATACIALLLPLLLVLPQRYRPLRESHLGAGVLDTWRQSLKDGTMGDRLGRAIAEVEPDAVIVADWEQATPLWYYQQVNGLRPGVQIVYPITRFEEAASLDRPLYLARNYSGVPERWHPFAAGPLVALKAEPTTSLPPGTIPLGARLGDTLELAGYAQDTAQAVRPGDVLPLTLYWRALGSPAYDYSISLRLFGPDGQEVFRTDSQHPVLGTYPTSRWAAGEVVGDYYEIQLPFRLAPGQYRWGAIVYRALPGGGWENLKVASTDGEVAMGGAFEVKAGSQEQ